MFNIGYVGSCSSLEKIDTLPVLDENGKVTEKVLQVSSHVVTPPYSNKLVAFSSRGSFPIAVEKRTPPIRRANIKERLRKDFIRSIGL